MSGERSTGLGRRLVANTLHAASGRLAALLVWLVYTPYLLRGLGPESFGLWSLFFAITGTLFAFDLGLHQATLRHVADAHARSDPEAAGSFATLGLLTFAVLGALWFGVAFVLRGPVLELLQFPEATRADAAFVLLAGAIVFAIMGCAQVTIAVAQGYGRFDLGNMAMLAITAQHAVGIPVVLSQGWGLRGLVINVGLGWCLGLLVANVAIRRVIPEFRWRSPRAARARIREAMRFGGPMQVAVAAFAGHQHLDKFLLVPLVALAAVAPYELGYRASNAALSLVQLLLLAIVPAAAALHAQQDPGRLLELYRRGVRYVLTAATVMFTSLAVAADRLFLVWLGPGNDDAAFVLRGLALASGLLVLSGMGTSIARGMGRTDIEAWFAVIVVSVHAVVALVLMPAWGLAGAIAGMVSGTFAGVVFFLWRLAGALGWPRSATMLEPHGVPLLAAAAGAGAGLFVDRSLPVSGWTGFLAVAAATGLVVFAVIVVTRYLRWGEVHTLLIKRGWGAWQG